MLKEYEMDKEYMFFLFLFCFVLFCFLWKNLQILRILKQNSTHVAHIVGNQR